MIAKLGIVEEEADETQFWLELLTDTGRAKPEATKGLIGEADQLLRIVVTSIKSIRSRSDRRVREVGVGYDPFNFEGGEVYVESPQSTIHNPQ